MAFRRSLGKLLFRYVLPLLLILLVAWRFYAIIRDKPIQWQEVSFRWHWALACMSLYLLVHSSWAYYWHRLVSAEGLKPSVGKSIRAYFISQAGKYIPGKIWVLVLRAVLLGQDKRTRLIIGTTAMYEGLTSMAAGAFLAALLLPRLELQIPLYGIDSLAMITLGLMPLGLLGLHRLLVRLTKKKYASLKEKIPPIYFPTLLLGMLWTACGWFLFGLSVWCATRCVLSEPIPMTWDGILRLTAINAIAYVSGFIVLFAPAGAGVREVILQTLLTLELARYLPEEQTATLAIICALAIRLFWTLAELIIGSICFYFSPILKLPTQASIVETMETAIPEPVGTTAIAHTPGVEAR